MFFTILVVTLITFLIWLCRVIDLNLSSLRRMITDFSTKKDCHFFSIIFGVDEHSKRHGGQLVAAVLKSHGIQELFTLCGGHISPILVAAEELGLKIFDTRHEATAVFAADSVARLRQSVGVAVVTAGPGLTNTITAIKNAQMAESPVILIAGAAPTLLRGRGALQDIDQLALMRPLCKSVSRIVRLRDIVPTLRKAIQVAQSDTPGPVFVEIPLDVLYPLDLVRKEFASYKDSRSLKQKIINLYLTYHISQQFGNAWIDQEMTPLKVKFPLPKEKDIEYLAELISKAEKPLLLIGSQALLPPVKATELQEIVDHMLIPTYLSGMARGLLGRSSRVHMKRDRKKAIKAADLIILAGAVCDFRLSYGKVLPNGVKIVSINRNYEQLTKNEGFFWKSHLKIHADVATTLVKLNNFIKLNKIKITDSSLSWLHCLGLQSGGTNVLCINEETEEISGKSAQSLINPIHVLREIDDALPDNVILVVDGGDFVGTAAYIVEPRGPLQWLDPGAFGTLGVGAGFALGAKAVYPERPVVILYGDGSCGFSLIEFDTFTRHKLSVIALIGNDACWSQIAREQVTMFGSSVAVNLMHRQYELVGVAMGAHGEHMMNPSEANAKHFKRIFEMANAEKSVVVNIVMGKSNFRNGSISV